MMERRTDDKLIQRIDSLELGHMTLQNAVALNTKITDDGFREINAKLDNQTEMFEHYKAAKLGGMFLTKLGALVIALGGSFAFIREWLK
jgi:hypothetical protein